MEKEIKTFKKLGVNEAPDGLSVNIFEFILFDNKYLVNLSDIGYMIPGDVIWRDVDATWIVETAKLSKKSIHFYKDGEDIAHFIFNKEFNDMIADYRERQRVEWEKNWKDYIF